MSAAIIVGSTEVIVPVLPGVRENRPSVSVANRRSLFFLIEAAFVIGPREASENTGIVVIVRSDDDKSEAVVVSKVILYAESVLVARAYSPNCTSEVIPPFPAVIGTKFPEVALPATAAK